MQNLPVAGVFAPHFGQQKSIGALHSMQNLAPSGFSNWHFRHFIPAPAEQGILSEHVL
jgi:hypothetical protein